MQVLAQLPARAGAPSSELRRELGKSDGEHSNQQRLLRPLAGALQRGLWRAGRRRWRRRATAARLGACLKRKGVFARLGVALPSPALRSAGTRRCARCPPASAAPPATSRPTPRSSVTAGARSSAYGTAYGLRRRIFVRHKTHDVIITPSHIVIQQKNQTNCSGQPTSSVAASLMLIHAHWSA